MFYVSSQQSLLDHTIRKL